MNDTHTNQNSRPSRKGELNPMANRHHSEQTKSLMRQKALQRNQEYKKWKDSQHHVSMEEFLSNNPTVKEYISTLVKEETDKLDKLIKEEIDKLVWNKQHQRIQIPNSWE